MIDRTLHEKARSIQRQNIGTPEYHAAMRLRKIWCEGNFSHQKANHNLTRTRKRGIERVTEQCLLSACALNLKRLVKYLGRNPCRLTIPLLSLFLCWRTGFLLWLGTLCQQHRFTSPFQLPPALSSPPQCPLSPVRSAPAVFLPLPHGSRRKY